MSGPSKTEQQQQSTTDTSSSFSPWAAAQPYLSSIFGALGSLPANASVSPTEDLAFTSLMKNAQSGNPYAQPIAGYASNLLSGGGANAQAGNVSQGLTDYQTRLAPTADATPGVISPQLQTALDTVGTDIANRTNAYYQGAGRGLSGANATNVSRGLAAGEAPLLLSQYNTDLQNKLGAATALFGAGNTTAGILSGFNQTGLANQGQGVDAATAALQARDSPYNQMLAIEAAKRGIPVQNLAALTQIGVPLAQLGGTSTGTANRTGTVSTQAYQSPQQQAWGWMNAFANLGSAFKPGGGGAVPGAGAVLPA